MPAYGRRAGAPARVHIGVPLPQYGVPHRRLLAPCDALRRPVRMPAGAISRIGSPGAVSGTFSMRRRPWAGAAAGPRGDGRRGKGEGGEAGC